MHHHPKDHTISLDFKVIMPLNDIAIEQTKATEKHRRKQISDWTTLPLILTPLSDITNQT
jgi:hypothetical protein